MKKIDLTREITILQLSSDELVTIQKLLREFYDYFEEYDFSTQLPVSLTEVSLLAKKLKIIIDVRLLEDNKIQFNYTELLVLQGAINEVCQSTYMQNLLGKIGITQKQLLPLVEFIDREVISQMLGVTLLDLISNKREEIVQKINLNSSQIKLSRTSQPIKKEGYLRVGSHLFLFVLSSMEDAKGWSNLQILEIDSQENKRVLAKSVLHKIEPWYLSQIIAYLEICKDLISQSTQPEIFILSPLSYKHHNVCRLQVVSGTLDSEERGFLQIRFSLNAQDQKDNFSTYREAEGLSSFAELEDFTSSIYDFLVNLSLN